MNAIDSRLTWIQATPKPADLYVAECGMYTFEICRTHEQGYLLQMWLVRPEDWPVLIWEMDGFSLDEAKERAERLADQHVPVLMR